MYFSLFDKCIGIIVPDDDSTTTIKSEDDVTNFLSNEVDGTVTSVKCYTYGDYVYPAKKKESIALFYVGIVLLVFAVVAIIVSLVVFFALKRKNLKPKDGKNGAEAPNVNDMNRGVEMNSVYSTSNYPTMYFANAY